MRKFLLVPLLLGSLALSGCAGTPVGDALRVVTTTITNPVGATQIYQVKNAYAAALTVVVSYREYCWARPYAVLMADPVARPVCEKRRQVVRVAQSARLRARAALNAAENFIANNPTLNAATAVQAAWTAVADFQNSVPRPQ